MNIFSFEVRLSRSASERRRCRSNNTDDIKPGDFGGVIGGVIRGIIAVSLGCHWGYHCGVIGGVIGV